MTKALSKVCTAVLRRQPKAVTNETLPNNNKKSAENQATSGAQQLNSSTAQQPTKATATSRLWLVSNFDIWSLKLCAISTFSVYTHTHTHTHTHTCIQNMLKFADCFRLTLWLSFSLTFHQHISPPSNLPIHTHSHTHIMGHEYWSFACNAFQLFCNWNF